MKLRKLVLVGVISTFATLSNAIAVDFSDHGFFRGKFTKEQCTDAAYNALKAMGWSPNVSGYVVLSSNDQATIQYTCVVDLGAYYIINGDKNNAIHNKFVPHIKKQLGIQ